MSVRTRLLLLFFAITTAAVVFIYLYVVPQLSSSLTAEKLSRLEQVGTEESQRIAAAMETPGPSTRAGTAARAGSASSPPAGGRWPWTRPGRGFSMPRGTTRSG